MSILSPVTGYVGYKVIDDATRLEIQRVLWVDDVALEYQTVKQPAYHPYGGLDTDVVKVTAVTVNHAAREIHVNTPQPIVLSISVGTPERVLRACGECCQEATCRRTDYCARYRCGFGQEDKP
jgi:hypothetical protein